MNILDVATVVIRPALQLLGPGLQSEAAERLLLGTGAHESDGFKFLRQQKGPALGPFQMEPRTHDDIWRNWLRGRPLATKVRQLISSGNAAAELPNSSELAWNWRYAAAMCRLHYARVDAPLPKMEDIAGMAAYWKLYYNTPVGRGTPEQFLAAYRKYVLPVVAL